jgi:adenine-specific DNA-methyltransferase
MPYDITRTELVWPGKYDEQGKRREVDRVSLPFQIIERVNESRATREAEKERNPTLFDVWQGDSAETFEEGWRNKLIWGDNKLVMSSLLDQFAGKVDLIYIDPPFATGADFSFTVEIGDGLAEITKAQSLIEEKAYRDTWGRGSDSYLQMMFERLAIMRDLLSPNGSMYLHCDRRMNAYLRAIMDDLFGRDNLRNEIIWCYRGGGTPQNDFAEKHDTIFRYSKGETYYFDVDPVRIPYSAASAERLRHQANVFRGDKVYRDYKPHDLGKHPEDWWTVQPLMPSEKQERIAEYPTQKPVELLQKIIDSSCPPGGLVLDAFAGSGTTAVTAEGLRVLRDEKDVKSLSTDGLKRRWIGCDLSRYAIHTTRKRLLHVQGCGPFEVLNLGKYERKYWQVATFGEDLDKDGEIALYEYVAFILKLYGATPATGLAHLHGKIGRAFVHVGAVDSPVTIDEIVACVDECIALRTKELHILGWEWEMGLHDPMTDEANSRGVQLVLRQIPREVMEQQAAAKGDVAFFELAYLDVEIKPRKGKREFAAHLRDFVIPNPELVPDDVRSKIKKWSDYVDYWAVDWTFADDTFIQGWVTYRTRKNRSLDLESDLHTYDAPGEYAVMVKVIDIFGNDTSKIIRVTVS